MCRLLLNKRCTDIIILPIKLSETEILKLPRAQVDMLLKKIH